MANADSSRRRTRPERSSPRPGDHSPTRSASLPLPVTASSTKSPIKQLRKNPKDLDKRWQENPQDLCDADVEKQTAKNARIETGGLRVRWARFKQRLGTGSALSESLLDGGADSTESSRSYRRGNNIDADGDDEEAEVDEVVVDNDMGGTVPSEPGSGSAGDGTKKTSIGTGDSWQGTHGSYGFWESNAVLTFLRWRLWPAVLSYFRMQFMNENMENSYRKEIWATSKSLGLYTSLFFIINWASIIASAAKPYTLSDKLYYFAFGPFLCFPIPFMVIYDVPHKWPRLFQIYFFFPVWSWASYFAVFMFACDFGQTVNTCGTRTFIGVFYYAIGLPTIAMFGLRHSRFAHACGALLFFILNAALIAPNMKTWGRNIVNAMLFHIFISYICYKRETSERRLFALRDQLKVQFRATQKAQVNERKAADSKRRLTSYVFHEVRVPLNTALLAVQNLEATNEFIKEQDIEWTALGGSLSMMSKVLNDVLDFDRLDSGRFSTVKMPYNLHQVINSMLVPLRLAADTRGLTLHVELDRTIDQIARRACYAAQGHDAAWIEKEMANNSEEDGLVVGDEMRLRQVINNLASNACKFTPHGGEIRIVTKLISPTNVPDRLLESDNPKPPVERKAAEHQPAEKVVSDEKRDPPVPLPKRHSSKSSKKSGPAGRAKMDTLPPPAEDEGYITSELSAEKVSLHNSMDDLKTMDWIVVRVEVHDTGFGIRAKDLIDNKLFSPYVQTEIGKYQGGKGTGLGLALVRRIVKLSGGRLGVKSKLGAGSTFWVELPLGVGKKALSDSSSRPEFTHDGSEYSEGRRQRALNLEEMKFLRAVGEGDTPSTAAVDHDEVTPSTLVDESFLINPTQLNNAPAAPTSHQSTAIVSAPPTMSYASGRAFKSIMDQRGPFELPAQVNTRAKPDDLRAPAPPPLTVTPATPPTASVQEIATKNEVSNSDSVNNRSDANAAAAAPSLRDGSLAAPDSEEHDMSEHLASPPTLAGPSYSAPTPLVSLPLQAHYAEVLSRQPSPPKGVRVLVVDDDNLTRRLMSRMLVRLGCDVETAENGRIALEKILGGSQNLPANLPNEPGGSYFHHGDANAAPTSRHEYIYDVIFLDNQMPVMSGLDTVTVLRSLGRRDLVIGVTGNALLSDQQEYLDVGVDRVLTKPVFEASLKAMLTLAAQRRKDMKLPPPTQRTNSAS